MFSRKGFCAQFLLSRLKSPSEIICSSSINHLPWLTDIYHQTHKNPQTCGNVYSSANLSTDLVHLWNWIYVNVFPIRICNNPSRFHGNKKRFSLPLNQWEGLGDTPHLFCAFKTLKLNSYESLRRDLVFMFILVAINNFHSL